MASAWHVCVLELSLEEHSTGPLLHTHLPCCAAVQTHDVDDDAEFQWLCVGWSVPAEVGILQVGCVAA